MAHAIRGPNGQMEIPGFDKAGLVQDPKAGSSCRGSAENCMEIIKVGFCDEQTQLFTGITQPLFSTKREVMWLSFRSHLEVTGPHTMGTEFTHKVLTKSLCV